MTSLYEEVDEAGTGDVPVRRITFSVNGARKVAEVEPRLLLSHLIRQGLGLTGTHMGCDTTNCGACTVLVDGKAVKSCTMLAVQADGHDIQTAEPGMLAADAACVAKFYRGRLSRDLWFTPWHSLTRAQKVITDAGYTKCMTPAQKAATLERSLASVVGKHPELAKLDMGNLVHHTDFRQVYAAVLDKWLGVDSKEVLGKAYTPVDVLA